MSEEALLTKITIEHYLSQLNEERRMVLMLTEGLWVPDDWTEGKLTYAAIGRYIGRRFRNRPLGEATIRAIREKALQTLNPDRPGGVPGRRRRRNSQNGSRMP